MAENLAVARSPYLIGALAWAVPGAGHWFVGERGRGIAIFAGIWTIFILGLILGGVEIVSYQNSLPWFVAQMCSGLPGLIGFLLQSPDAPAGFGRGIEFGQVYTGVAGLLNVICILDAISRALGSKHQDVES